MKTNSFIQDFAARFEASSIQELVDNFNQSVGNRGWTFMRATHDKALIDDFIRRGIDISAIHHDNATSFAHTVDYDESLHKLVIV